MDEIKNRIRKALEIRGMTFAELAKKTDISKASISQYVSGYTKPKANRIYTMAKALEVSEVWLLGYDVPMEAEKSTNQLSSLLLKNGQSDTRLDSIIENYNQLNEAGKDDLAKHAEHLTYIPEYTRFDNETPPQSGEGQEAKEGQ